MLSFFAGMVEGFKDGMNPNHSLRKVA